jgi:hypothetical protein
MTCDTRPLSCDSLFQRPCGCYGGPPLTMRFAANPLHLISFLAMERS